MLVVNTVFFELMISVAGMW